MIFYNTQLIFYKKKIEFFGFFVDQSSNKYLQNNMIIFIDISTTHNRFIEKCKKCLLKKATFSATESRFGRSGRGLSSSGKMGVFIAIGDT